MQGQETSDIVTRLDQIDQRIGELRDLLVDQMTVKDFYKTHEVTKAEFTVREWCRLDRVAASKRACGRGKFLEWIVSHEELTRLRNEGLLPARKG
jgi:hypothetical protein